MNLIDAAKAKLGSYRAVAKYLGVHETMVSTIRAGRRPLPSYHAGKLAELLEMNPAQAYVEAEIQAAQGKAEAASLRRWFSKVAAIIAAVSVVAGYSGSWSPISSTYAANGNLERTGSVLPDRYSMRPILQWLAASLRNLWRWLRSQPEEKRLTRTRGTGGRNLSYCPACVLH